MLQFRGALASTSGAALIAALLILGEGPPAAQSAGPVLPGVAEKVAQEGRLSVIVGVRSPVAGIELVDGVASLQRRQADLRAALDPLIQAAADAGLEIGLRFQNLPLFGATVDSAGLQWLAEQVEVTFVQESHRMHPMLAQSVPLIRAPEAWAAGATGGGWYVGVLDTGIAAAHPFLQGKVSLREMCISTGALRDTDPDAPTIGVTLCPPPANISYAPGSGAPCSLADCEHGTHVAGIVAGGTVAGGVSGVAPGATLISAQVFRKGLTRQHCGANPAPIPCIFFEEVDYLYAMDVLVTWNFLHFNEKLAAINLSFGEGGGFTSIAACDAAHPAARAAMTQLRLIDIAPIVASGNDGLLDRISQPACVTGAIRVGATTKQDLIWSFTNRASFLSLLAPGDNILSSVPGGSYQAFSGTSMAAPHVAGAWAVLKHAKPEATVNEILQALRSTGVPIPDPFAIPAATYRRIDVAAARLALLGPGPAAPAPPVNVAATVNGTTATLTWSPGVGGGLPTHYLVVAGTTPGGSELGLFNVGLTTTASGTLGPGTYYARIIAANGAGQSAPSAEVVFTVGGAVTVPGAPTGLTVVVNGSTATFAWQAPSTGGTVAEYQLVASLTPGGPVIATLLVSGTGITVPNIAPGTYYVRVVATNGAGSGPASNEVVVSIGVPPPPQAPGAPTALSSSAGGASVSLFWNAPTTGSAPTSYRVQAGSAPGLSNLADVSTGSTSTSFAASGVPVGLYYVRVRAENAGGVSGPSNEVTLVMGGPTCTGLLSVALTWNTGSSTGTPTRVDMDLHGFEPDGTHVYYGRTTGPSLRLVNDNTNGLGPEILCVSGGLLDGAYEIDTGAYAGNEWPTTATITVTTDFSRNARVFTRVFNGPDPATTQRVARITGTTAGGIAEVTGTRAVDPLPPTASVRGFAAKPGRTPAVP